MAARALPTFFGVRRRAGGSGVLGGVHLDGPLSSVPLTNRVDLVGRASLLVLTAALVLAALTQGPVPDRGVVHTTATAVAGLAGLLGVLRVSTALTVPLVVVAALVAELNAEPG
ncbi:MAG: hypothetical protein ACRCYU_10435, partial [Nocardioides sp.]